MLNKIYNEIKKDLKNYIEIIDEMEYYRKLVKGIVIYFPDGTAFQILKDIDNKEFSNYGYVMIDDGLFPCVINDNIEEFIKDCKELIYYRNIELIKENIELKLLNKEISFLQLDSFMVNEGFFSNLDCNIHDIKKYNDITYALKNEDDTYLQIYFNVIKDNKNDFIMKINKIRIDI